DRQQRREDRRSTIWIVEDLCVVLYYELERFEVLRSELDDVLPDVFRPRYELVFVNCLELLRRRKALFEVQLATIDVARQRDPRRHVTRSLREGMEELAVPRQEGVLVHPGLIPPMSMRLNQLDRRSERR